MQDDHERFRTSTTEHSGSDSGRLWDDAHRDAGNFILREVHDSMAPDSTITEVDSFFLLIILPNPEKYVPPDDCMLVDGTTTCCGTNARSSCEFFGGYSGAEVPCSVTINVDFETGSFECVGSEDCGECPGNLVSSSSVSLVFSYPA